MHAGMGLAGSGRSSACQTRRTIVSAPNYADSLTRVPRRPSTSCYVSSPSTVQLKGKHSGMLHGVLSCPAIFRTRTTNDRHHDTISTVLD